MRSASRYSINPTARRRAFGRGNALSECAAGPAQNSSGNDRTETCDTAVGSIGNETIARRRPRLDKLPHGRMIFRRPPRGVVLALSPHAIYPAIERDRTVLLVHDLGPLGQDIDVQLVAGLENIGRPQIANAMRVTRQLAFDQNGAQTLDRAIGHTAHRLDIDVTLS